MTSSLDAWVALPRPAAITAKKRLFCFPFAGGGATAYRKWAGSLGPHIEVCAIQLPGRESRLLDPALDDVDALVAALLEHLPSYFDRPYAFYGHSMGALLAFELTRSIEKLDGLRRPTPTNVTTKIPFIGTKALGLREIDIVTPVAF